MNLERKTKIARISLDLGRPFTRDGRTWVPKSTQLVVGRCVMQCRSYAHAARRHHQNECPINPSQTRQESTEVSVG